VLAEPRFLRLVEIACDDPKQTRDDLHSRHRELMRRTKSKGEPQRLDLVVFGTVDILSIQQVGDLKQLSVAATYLPTRFQRSSGAWTPHPFPEVDPCKPYMSVSYFKLNPLADLLLGATIAEQVFNHIAEQFPKDVWVLRGLDIAQVVVIHASSKIAKFAQRAWRLRNIRLGQLPVSWRPEFATYCGISEADFPSVRVFSWSHSVVGMPYEFVFEQPALFDPQDRQMSVTLRTRYRKLPGASQSTIGADQDVDPDPVEYSVLGAYDYVHDVEEPRNEVVRARLKNLVGMPTHIAETEVRLKNTDEADEDTEQRLSAEGSTQDDDDLATAAFCGRLRLDRGLINNFKKYARPRDWRSEHSRRPWSPQRLNGGINIILAFQQRFSDPFVLGQAWRLYEPLLHWIECTKTRAPQDPELVQWGENLERAIRIDADQEDPSYRPSLPLSFASRGGYVALREAFVAYVEQVAKAWGNIEQLPLIVDSVETRLTLHKALDTFILRVSGAQIQAFYLWPFVIHEVEHLRIDAVLEAQHHAPVPRSSDSGEYEVAQDPDGAEQPNPMLMIGNCLTEALCDLAMIESGSLGKPPATAREPSRVLVDRAIRVVAWSLIGDWQEDVYPAKPDDESNLGRRDETTVAAAAKFGLRIAFLYLLYHDQPVSRASVMDFIKGTWWGGWMETWQSVHRTAIKAERLYSSVRDLVFDEIPEIFASDADISTGDVHELRQSTWALRDKLSEPPSSLGFSCIKIVAKFVEQIPRWDHDNVMVETIGLPLKPLDVIKVLEDLAPVVAAARRKHFLHWFNTTPEPEPMLVEDN
jgi:hypothetical protein